MEQTLVSPIICEEYDLEHDCITLQELQWILHTLPRHSPYWMYFVLRVTTGIRPDEAAQLTLYHLNTACTAITYRVDKPSTKKYHDTTYVLRHKHRRLTLDPWVQKELKTYLDRTCRSVNGVYVSPYPGQKLFPWKNMNVIGAFWYKLRQRMANAGFDSQRIQRTFTHRHTLSRKSRSIHHTFVLRPHILRHFAASVMFAKLGNLASVRDWIKHEDCTITNGYIHSPEKLGTTLEYLRSASWAAILGYDAQQTNLTPTLATAQTTLQSY